MKLSLVTTLAALALAGAAFAQPGAPARLASDFEGSTSGQDRNQQAAQAHDMATGDMLRSVRDASSRMRLACAADRARLCADSRTTFGADRCLDRHRKDVIEPCRTALSQAAMAWNAPR